MNRATYLVLTVLAGLVLLVLPLHGQAQNNSPPVVVTSDGQRIITAMGNAISVTDAQTQKELVRIMGHTGPVTALGVSPDGKILASGSTDKSIALFDLPTGKQILKLTVQATVVNLTFSNDGKNLRSREEDKSVKLWEIATGKLLQASKNK
jgi:WD40 repeat protein